MIFSIKMQIVRRLMTALSHHPGKIANELAINRYTRESSEDFFYYITKRPFMDWRLSHVARDIHVCALSAF